MEQEIYGFDSQESADSEITWGILAVKEGKDVFHSGTGKAYTLEEADQLADRGNYLKFDDYVRSLLSSGLKERINVSSGATILRVKVDSLCFSIMPYPIRKETLLDKTIKGHRYLLFQKRKDFLLYKEAFLRGIRQKAYCHFLFLPSNPNRFGKILKFGLSFDLCDPILNALSVATGSEDLPLVRDAKLLATLVKQYVQCQEAFQSKSATKT